MFLSKCLLDPVVIISGLDSQSRIQMFTLFFGRSVGVRWRYTNMAAPYCARIPKSLSMGLGFLSEATG